MQQVVLCRTVKGVPYFHETLIIPAFIYGPSWVRPSGAGQWGIPNFGFTKFYDRICGNKPATTLTGAQSDDVGDCSRDLIACAYLESRGDSGPDVGYGGGRNTDVVVDCSNRDDQ